MLRRRSQDRLGIMPFDALDLGAGLAVGLESISYAVGVTPTARDVRRQARVASLDLGGRNWRLALSKAVEPLGLRGVEVESTIAELGLTVGRGRPGLIGHTREGNFEWLVVLESSRGGHLVFEPGLAGPKRLSETELAERLGVTPATRLSLLLFFPAFPLASLESRPDDEGGPRSPFSRLWALVVSEREDVLVIVLFAAGVGLLSLATPIAVQALVSSVAFGTLLQPLVVIGLLLLGGLALSGTLTVFETYVLEILQRRIFVRVTADIAGRLPRANLEALGARYRPELVNRFFDLFTVQKAAASLLLDGLDLALKASVGLILLAVYHPVLLAFDLALIASLAFIVFAIGRKGAATAIKESKAKYRVAHWLQEITRTPTASKNGEGASHALERVDELAHDYLAARKSHFRVVLNQTVGSVGLQALASAVLLVVGGWLVVARELTLGQLVAAELVVTLVVAAFGKLSKQLETFYDLLAAVDKLGQLIDLPLERPEGAALASSKEGPASLRIVGLGYAHRDARAPVLEGVDLEVEPGQRVGIVGDSGSGKSTMAEILYRLRIPSTGRVELDGRNLEDLEASSLRSSVALLGRLEIVSGTILDNLRHFSRDVDITRIRSALERLGLDASIAALPNGLETELSPEGAPLPASAARLIGLARALVSSPSLLVIDEYLDALPADARRRALDVIFDEGRRQTVIVMTDRPDVLERCDRVYRLAAGQLAPVGRAEGGK